MTITSTEFQQNVGYYLKEAQAGKELLITRSKPSKAVFKLVLQEKETEVKTKKKFSEVEFYKLMAELGIRNHHESGLEFQRRVRS
jgi:antitoxin (DNA-binding transcriptional repressor) of toxin-antitoxin stability system